MPFVGPKPPDLCARRRGGTNRVNEQNERCRAGSVAWGGGCRKMVLVRMPLTLTATLRILRA